MTGSSSRTTDATVTDFITANAPVYVITGAGISTASGIPDYRDAAREWKRPPPVLLQAFLDNPAARARYWARSYVGWPRFEAAHPNVAHDALVVLERRGLLQTLVTQNVDRLHQRAGHHDVIDLHGRLDRVVCVDCGELTSRGDLQTWFAVENAGFSVRDFGLAPDGDADLGRVATDDFRFPDCSTCGGILKPDVVFYGENVPRQVVVDSMAMLERADGLLLLGTSASTYSCFRYCRRAHALQLPMAIVNLGQTRADDLASLTLAADVGQVLERCARLLG